MYGRLFYVFNVNLNLVGNFFFLSFLYVNVYKVRLFIIMIFFIFYI